VHQQRFAGLQAGAAVEAEPSGLVGDVQAGRGHVIQRLRRAERLGRDITA